MRYGRGTRGRARASIIAVTMAAAALAGVGGASPAAGASTSEFRATGAGWGHGVGMSQYGARGMALAGYKSGAILKHYYSGISITSRATGSIRVLIETGPDVVVTSSSSFTARKGSTTLATSSSSYPYLRALPRSDGYEVQKAGSKSGPWSTVKTVSSGPVNFHPGGSHLSVAFDGGGSRSYRGIIRAYKTSSTKIRTLNVLDMEEYLYGVVPWEMPASWPMQALKAQAMVARSYALNQLIRKRAAGSWYDICATTSCQVYGGASAESSRATDAVNKTKDKVATHSDGSTTADGVALTVFSSSTGGRTENNTDGFGSSVQYPYLRSVADPWSIDPDVSNPYASWERSISASTLASKVGLDSVSSARITDRYDSGSPSEIVFVGTKSGTRATASKTGRWMRSAFGLPSANIATIFSPPFVDDDGSTHEADIVAIWREGITAGCGGDRYCPTHGLARGEMASLLARALGLPAASDDYFADDNGHLHEDAINRLFEAGLTGGCAADAYCPDRVVERAEMATFLARGFGHTAAVTTDHFTDDDGSTHEANINRIAQAGIAGGCAADLFCPAQKVTRAQTASFLARALGLT